MWKIIVVEDEKNILELSKHLLEKSGLFQVVAAYTYPLEALEHLSQTMLTADVLMLDIEMPKMTGLELAANLVEIGIDVPIVFSTAYKQYAIEAFRVQALDYLLKPMTPNIVLQLNERLAKYYGRQLPMEQSKQTIMTICLYGEVDAHVNGVIVKWPTKVTEELFYFLLVNEKRMISKYRIIDALWPNRDEKSALSNLYNTIYRMRQLFTELNLQIEIQRVNDGYTLIAEQAIQIEPKLNEDAFLLESKGYLWSYSEER